MKILILLLSFTLTQCASLSPKEASKNNYKKHITKRLKEKQAYNGWYNTYHIRIALLDTKAQELQNKLRSYQFQWDEYRNDSEEKNLQKKLSTYTEAFMSFYVPNPKNDKLEQKNISLWKIFLDVGGQRFEGKINKLRKVLDEINTYYPFHSRWSTPYLITFPSPSSLVDYDKARIIMTGPLGTAEFQFLPTKDK